jgi:hypothetical protein
LAPRSAGDSGDDKPRRRWADWVIGITVGVVLGLGVLVYFVFVHSEGTIDAPSVKGGAAGQTTTASGGESNPPAHPGSPEEPGAGESGSSEGGESGAGGNEKPPPPKQVPIVKVIGGAPPTGAGPKQLTFHKGEKVEFEIETTEPFSFEIKGLGVTKSIDSSSIISFKATKAGQFPVISTTTLIGVADLLIKKK